MHENKFEKQVRQKMEELDLVPSDAVWGNVAREINKKEKRRSPVFWFLFAGGVALLGGAYLYWPNANRNAKNSLLSANENKRTENINKGSKPAAGNNSMALNKNGQQKNTLSDDIKTGQNNAAPKTPTGPVAKRGQRPVRNKIIPGRNGLANTLARTEQEATAANNRSERILSMAGSGNQGSPEEKNIDGIAGKSKINKEAVSGKRDEADLSPNSKNNRSEKNKHDIIADINLPKKDPPIDRATGKDKQQQKKSASWRISINSVAGISNVFGSGLSSSYVSGPLFSFQNGGYALAPGTAYYPPSKIGPYLSAGFGLAAEKKIAKKFSVSAGIRYRFYSTRVSALQFVDSSTYVYVSSNNLLQVNGYYVPGSKNYVNFYHFLELPVLINMQINKSEKHPLLWQAGFSVSYLMATNALHFDPSGNIYYKDKSLFNKAQANLVTGIMLGSPFYKGELRYGLQFQYGLTRLLNKQAGDTEHLFFAGIGLSYLLPKK